MCFFSTLTIIYCRHSWNITFPFRTANFLRQFKTNVLETTLWIIKTEISNLVSRARYWNNLQISSEWKDSFIVKIRLPYEYHGMCLIRDMNWLSFARSWVQPRMLVMFTHAPVFNPGCWWCSYCSSCYVSLLCFLLCLSSSYFLCCQLLWIVHYWLHLQFSLKLLASLPWWYNVNIRLWTAQQYHLYKQC